MRLYCAPALRPRAANFSQRVVSLVCLHCGSPLKSSSTWICTSGWTPLFFQGGGKSKLLFQLKPWWPSVVQGFALGKVAFCSSGFASSMAAFCLLSTPLEKKWGFSETCVANPLLHALLPCSNILWLKRLWHAEESHSHQHHKPSELIAKQAARKEERKSSQKIFYVN